MFQVSGSTHITVQSTGSRKEILGRHSCVAFSPMVVRSSQCCLSFIDQTGSGLTDLDFSFFPLVSSFFSSSSSY